MELTLLLSDIAATSIKPYFEQHYFLFDFNFDYKLKKIQSFFYCFQKI